MPRGILYVESRPGSPEDADSYHAWYEGTHFKEMLQIEGVVSARRYAALGDDAPYIAVYELDADDITAVRARIAEAAKAGRMSAPVGVSTDPPPRMWFCREIAVHTV
ncbi:hypothetical protein [Actinocorallia populi]|uniref:hypothetical protein n=1 Tax=Actinocorallia populi TaxID=2079200 RepID=UPI000D09029F|nr:hypothetical protein [Actinocorallia populi]